MKLNAGLFDLSKKVCIFSGDACESRSSTVSKRRRLRANVSFQLLWLFEGIFELLCLSENVPCYSTSNLSLLRGCIRARLFVTDVFKATQNLGIFLYSAFIFHCHSPLHVTWELLFQQNNASKGNGLCVLCEAVANPVNAYECVGRAWQRAGVRHNANISCIYVTGAAPRFLRVCACKVQIHVGWENNSVWFRGRRRRRRGRASGIRDQTNCLECEEDAEEKEEEEGLMEGVTGKCSHTPADRPLRCERGKDDCLFSNLAPAVIPLSIHTT